MKKLFQLARGYAVVALMLVLTSVAMVSPASATVTIDPTDTLAIVTEANAFIVAVGLAVLGLVYTARGIKWARKAG